MNLRKFSSSSSKSDCIIYAEPMHQEALACYISFNANIWLKGKGEINKDYTL
jgi:hypothetical protein